MDFRLFFIVQSLYNNNHNHNKLETQYNTQKKKNHHFQKPMNNFSIHTFQKDKLFNEKVKHECMYRHNN